MTDQFNPFVEVPQPYEVWGWQPKAGPATILGAPVETSFRLLRELAIPGGTVTPGAQIQFPRNGVVTGLKVMTRLSSRQSATPQTLAINLIKDGTHSWCTDGFNALPFDLQDVTGPFEDWMRVWIPVNQGEIWRSNAANLLQEEDPQGYSIVLRVETFLERPKAIPELLTQTQLYRAFGSIDANQAAATAYEWDFRTKGIVTGLRAAAAQAGLPFWDQGAHTNVQAEILLSGKKWLSSAYQTGVGLDLNELSSQGSSPAWTNLRQSVDRHEKWQIWLRNLNTVEYLWEVCARVEEQCPPWEKW